MAFDLSEISPEVKKTPEMTAPPENKEVGLEVSQPEQAPTVEATPSPVVAPQEVPQPVQAIEAPPAPQEVQVVKDELLTEVESILADKTIMAIYAKLPESKKRPFKEIGEDLARNIRDAIRARKVKPHKILHGIKKWLSVIPDIEKFYLLQEAKIDLDQVLTLAEEQGVTV